MKMADIHLGWPVQISNEESIFLLKHHYDDNIVKEDLNEQEFNMAENLVRKDVLIRKQNNHGIYYVRGIKKSI